MTESACEPDVSRSAARVGTPLRRRSQACLVGDDHELHALMLRVSPVADRISAFPFLGAVRVGVNPATETGLGDGANLCIDT